MKTHEIESLSIRELDVEELEQRLEMTLVPLAKAIDGICVKSGGGGCDAFCSQQCAQNG